jgi:hypothetical protein
MMVKPFWVLVADVALVLGEYSVLLDVQSRSAYAASAHAGISGYAPSYSYSVLIQFFTMTGGGASLTSPPTLDWTQAIVLTLVVLNSWFVYKTLASRKARSADKSPVIP